MGIKGLVFHETNSFLQSRCSLLGGVPGFSGVRGIRCHNKATALVLKVLATLGLIENKIHEIEMAGETHYLNRNSLVKWLEAQPECPKDDDLNDCIQAVIDSKTHINDLPDEVLSLIFSRSLPKDVGNCARVNRSWKNLTREESLWVNSLACGAVERWLKHFGSVGEVPPLPPDIVSILKSPCPFWKEKKVWQTHRLTLIPDTVNGEPLTLNSLEKLAEQKSPERKFEWFWPKARTEHGDTTIGSHCVLMTKGLIPGSRNTYYNPVKDHVGYEEPGLLEATCCIFMEHAISGAYFFGDPWTYTRCKEETGGYPLKVGSCSRGGLGVVGCGDGSPGVAAVRRL